MKEHVGTEREEKRKVAYSKADVIKLDTKCLYAGKLERITKWREKPHSHPFCEILFVFSGKGETRIDDVVYPIKKGDLIVCNPQAVHWESTLEDSGLELGCFGITNFQVSDLPFDHLISRDASPILHTGSNESDFNFYFRSLVKEMCEEAQYNELMAKYWARLILIRILRLANISESKFVANAIFTRIHQYLSGRFSEVESMDQVCDELGINKYYLSHVFKKYMGIPPMQYVTIKRISHAKKLLQETDMTASAIGEICGYKDHVLFFKAFKKLEGMTPLEYRKQARGPRTSPGAEEPIKKGAE